MKQEILPVNLLRFLAAFGVLFFHKFSYFLDIGFLSKNLSFLEPLTHYGYLGVNLFFLISGFVITLSSEGRTLGQFISARFVRLFPVFWICVSITTLFVLIFAKNESIPLAQYLANLTMMPHYYGDYTFIDGSYWTLELELKFYLLIALLLVLKKWFTISFQNIFLLLSIPLLYDALFYNPFSRNTFDTIISFFFHSYLGEYGQYFIAGVLFYGMYKNNTNRLYHYLALIICYIVTLLKALDNSPPSENPTIIAMYITAFFGIFLAISLKKISNETFSFLGKNSNKILITLGAATYPLYLLHSKIIGVLSESLLHSGVPTSFALILIIIELTAIIYLVNVSDLYIRSLWKKSFVVQNIIKRTNNTWIKKIM